MRTAAARPGVDRAVDALLGEGRELACLDGGEHQIRDAAGQAGDEEREHVVQRAARVAEVHPHFHTFEFFHIHRLCLGASSKMLPKN